MQMAIKILFSYKVEKQLKSHLPSQLRIPIKLLGPKLEPQPQIPCSRTGKPRWPDARIVKSIVIKWSQLTDRTDAGL